MKIDLFEKVELKLVAGWAITGSDASSILSPPAVLAKDALE